MKVPALSPAAARVQRILPTVHPAVVAFGVYLALSTTCWSDLVSGVYHTAPGALVEEQGDRVTNRVRMVPVSATLWLEFGTNTGAITASITNAVLEGGNPFPLTVRSSSGSRRSDGTFWFTGDYLQNVYPAGTQYGFDWGFSSSTNGEVLWNGSTAWWGGHIWVVTISNLTLIPLPWLNATPAGTESVQLTWSSHFADHRVEYSTNLSATSWTLVTNAIAPVGDQLGLTVSTVGPRQFYRLRKP